MPTKPFIDYTYDDSVALFQAAAPVGDGTRTFPLDKPRRSAVAQTATLFYLSDHWQSSKGFIGQLPPPTLLGAESMKADIKAGFVSENVIREVTKTHVGGILGREPVWSFLPADPTVEADLSNESSFENTTGESLTPWWNERKALVDLQKAARTLVLEGRVVRRLFIPRGLLNSQGRATATDLRSALKFIYFETHTADVAGVFTDPFTQRQIGVFLFEEKDIYGEVTANCAELSFLDDNGDTICKVVKDKGDPATYGPYKLGGHLLVYELEREALITEQVQSQQRALNLAHTMMMRNINMAGSRERTITNAQPPISLKKTTTENTPDTTITKTFPGTFKTGAGAVNFVMGVPIHDENGQIVGYTNPNVTIVDPAPVDTFVKTADHYRSSMYSQCHQRHVLIVDKADTSGRAREVARREFERSLKETKIVMEAGGRWMLEATLRLSAQISNQSSKYADLRADFNCLLDAGEPDPEKQKTVIELRKSGLISAETGRNWIGVEDAAAELAKIKAETKEDPSQPEPVKDPNAPPNGGGTVVSTSVS